ncbi:hypothetical protein B0H16DRAFT_1683604 [Mycena metata]|uniref:Uncharacterized protein n=1 Tax=Mycena metata TaxID=1033252 RepID=A0AAD7K6S0_9AGAR|nr:hypothetical protein B0H16DRAFT_1683604 [Mycena metata]
MEEGSSRFGDNGQNDTYGSDHESLFSKFEAFLTRASACQTIFADASDRGAKLSPDPPNILHAATQQRFHAALQSLIGAPQVDPVPVVVIARRGTSDLRAGSGAGGREGDGVLDVWVVQGRDLLGGPYVTEIGWIQSHRTNAHETHFASAPKASGSAPTKEMLDIVVETSNGDIRSAIIALQFSCVPTLGGSSVKAARKKGGGAGGGAKLVLEAVTRREQSLTLFHFMGWERRSTEFQCHGEGHLAGSGAQRPAKAAQVLGSEERRTSRVNVDVLGHDRTKKLSHEEGSGVLRVHGLGTGTRCGAVYATCAPSASVKRGIGGKGRPISPSRVPRPRSPPSHSPPIPHHCVAAAHPRARVECTTRMCLPYARAARYARPHLPRLLPHPPSPVLSIPFPALM